MIRTIKSEIIKAKNMRFFLIFLIYIIISFLFLYLVFSIFPTDLKDNNFTNKFFSLFLKYNLTTSGLFFGILTIVNIGNDFKTNIYAKQFISGISKDQYVFEKLFFIIITGFLTSIIEFIKFSVLQIIFLNHFSFNTYIIFKFSFSYFLFFNIIGFFTFFIVASAKNTILSSVIFYIVYKTINFISVYETMKIGTNFSDYLPIKSAENIVQDFITTPLQIVLILLYIIIFIFLIFQIIKNQEIIINK